MPGKPILSPTKFSIYLACPQRYRWTYTDSRGRFYMRSKSAFSFGTALHRVLERFHDSGDTGVETIHEAVAALEESWLDAGFHNAEEMNDAYGEGQAILERYVEEAQQRHVSAKTIAVERTLRLDFPSFELVGRLDRIDEHEDGTMEVLDYKSGRQLVTSDDVRSDLAMNIYQLLLQRHYPGRPVRATILALRTGEQASASINQEEGDELYRDLTELGEMILAKRAMGGEPTYKSLCPRCDFLPLCRRDPAFCEAEAASRRSRD
jgi:RecB family exonuclease